MRGRWWATAGAVVFGASVTAAWSTLPEGPIPAHWSDTSAPDGFGTRGGLVLMLCAVAGGLGILLLGLAYGYSRSRRLPGLHVPSKTYWTRPENIGRARAMAVTMLSELVGMLWIFLAWVPWGIVAATYRPGHALPGWFLAGCALLLVGVVVRLCTGTRWGRPATDAVTYQDPPH